jgi:hypothetical protein
MCMRDVDVINTVRVVRRSFHVVSRRFASSSSVFPQLRAISVTGSIPGSSTSKGPRGPLLADA